MIEFEDIASQVVKDISEKLEERPKKQKLSRRQRNKQREEVQTIYKPMMIVELVFNNVFFIHIL